MKVRELIAELSKFDQEQEVVIINGVGSEEYVDEVTGLFLCNYGLEIEHEYQEDFDSSAYFNFIQSNK
jgi:hypothetical protein